MSANGKVESNTKEEKTKLIIEMAKNLQSTFEMTVGAKCANATAYKIIRENKIYTITQVIALLDEKTDEEIADEGNVYVEAVSRVRRDYKLGKIQIHVKGVGEKKKRRQIEIDREKLINSQRKEVELLLCFGNTIESIKDRTGLTRGEIEAIQKEVKAKQSLKTPQNEAKFKTKLMGLKSYISRLDKVEKNDRTIINFQIEKMLEDYGVFLTEEHYALFAYGYVKLGECDKAIKFGTKHLGLEEQSLEGLNKKIYEILEREKVKGQQNKVMQIDENGGR